MTSENSLFKQITICLNKELFVWTNSYNTIFRCHLWGSVYLDNCARQHKLNNYIVASLGGTLGDTRLKLIFLWPSLERTLYKRHRKVWVVRRRQLKRLWLRQRGSSVYLRGKRGNTSVSCRPGWHQPQWSPLWITNKKLRYREEHSASVVLSWCTLWHLSGDKQQINS